MSCKPRVIAAEIKKDPNKDVIQERAGPKPHIAGELALVGGVSSEPHWVEVSAGHLLVYPGVSPSSAPVWRLPLRHLNLQPAASGRPRGFSLSRHGETVPIATFQVDNELDYSRWVKTLAAELLKQTPLEAVKFLDILGITATIPGEADRSLSPEYHSEPENRSWELRCSPPSQESRKPSVPLSVPKNWYQRPLEREQPLSLIITEEPKKECRRSSFRKALNFDTASEDVIDGFRVMDSICQLAKQSKNCFRTCNKSGNENVPKCPEESVGKNRFKSLLKTFLSQESTKGVTSPGPLHPLDMKDDGRTGRPPLPDVVKDLPPCDRRSRARTRTPTPLRLRGKSVDVLPSTEDCRVAELMARCQQEDRYVPVRDKRLMFESLGRASSQPRFVLSSDNLMSLGDLTPTSEPPRTQSLHDLSANSVAVKEICRYFEQRGESRGELATRSPSPECRLRLHAPKPAKSLGEETLRGRQLARAERRLGRLRQNIAECEQTIWRLRGQSSKLSQNRREGSTRIQLALDCRLEEERQRLKRLQEEQYKVQREMDLTVDHFGIPTVKTRHHSDVR
uniref:PH domain-containing protein n=1 Tax=Cuerna arida TaxID=1464854 RepID=A0A1B6FLP1_9HEMI